MTDMPAMRAASLAAPVTMLGAANAVVVTIEFIVIGLLPLMARDLGISIPEAGGFVAWFALSAAVVGPVLTMAVSRFEPRHILCVTLLVFGLGNIVAVMLPGYAALLAVRIVQGALLPTFVSVGNAAIARLAGPGRDGRAIAWVNLGLVGAIVLAVPAGVVAANQAGWTATFFGLAVLALVAATFFAVAFPRLANDHQPSVTAQGAILRQPVFLMHLLLSGILFTAMFAAYSYLADFLETVAGFSGEQIGPVLFGFGLAGLAGNMIAGYAVDRWMMAATTAVAVILAVTNVAISFFGNQLVGLLPLLAVWGVAHMAAFVLCQVRVMRAGAAAPAFASSLNIAICNVGIACGAALGGWIVQHYGIANIGIGSGALAVCACTIALWLIFRSGATAMKVMPRPAGNDGFV